jgi:hypothetical protein
MKKKLQIGGLAFVVFIICICISPFTPSNSDGVNFLLALNDFDLDRHQPHFPGYPVYIVLGKCLCLLGLTAATSLASINSLALTGFFLVIVKLSKRPALHLLLPFLALPLLFDRGLIFGSDMAGLALWSVMILLVWEKEITFKKVFLLGLTGGLLLGLRLGYAPLLSVLLLPLFYKKEKFKSFAIVNLGLAAGLLLWLAPLSSYMGFSHYLDLGESFIHGHFNDWGGSALTESDPLARLTLLFKFMLSQILILCPLIYCAIKSFKSEKFDRLFWIVTLAPYLLFVLFGQNLSSSRHFLPLVLPVILVLSRLEFYLPKRWAFSVLLVLAITNLALRQVQHKTPAPQLAIVRFLESQKDIETATIYAGETQRFIEWLQPLWTVRQEALFDSLPFDFFDGEGMADYFVSIQNLEEKFPGEVKILSYFKNGQSPIGVFKRK